MKSLGMTLVAFLLFGLVGLFILPCIIMRIAIAAAHIAWLTAGDILPPLEKEPTQS